MKVLVLVARGLQASALGCYGNPWVETPALDSLAARGIVFDQHLADAASPDGAHAAWRSGRYHFPEPSGNVAPAASPIPDLLESLRLKGVLTHLLLDASRPAPGGFEAGWATVKHVSPKGNETPLKAMLVAAKAALTRLAQREDGLLWVDLATLLPPWDVPEEFAEPYFLGEAGDDELAEGEDADAPSDTASLTPLPDPVVGPIDTGDDTLFLRLRTSYAAAVSYLDAGVGQLLQALEEGEGGEAVVVVLTTDCGQALGEHGVVGPVRPWLHDEVLHLPLIVRLPRCDEAGRRVAALTQAVDLAPTLADVFEVPFAQAHGHSLLPLVYGETEQVRPYACAGLRVGQAVEWALLTPAWAFLLPVSGAEYPDAAPGLRLYVKPDDRWEVNNLVQHHLDLADQFEKTLRAFVAATRQPGPLPVPPPELPAGISGALPGV